MLRGNNIKPGLFLTLLIMTYIVLHHTLGPVPRMERILEKIISSDYSLRINVHKEVKGILE